VTFASDDGPLVVFDGDCAFCTSSINWLTHTFPGAFNVVPYQRTDLAALGLTAEQCHAQLQWLTDRARPLVAGNRRSGAQAVTAILRAGGRARGGPLGTAARVVGTVGSYPPVSWIAAAVYVVVAANRTRLPGGTPACGL
jgi:predicted DCC family thiol-disulfide oxidoreductase YuxK